MSRVIPFMRLQLSTCIRNNFIPLHQHCSKSSTTCIGVNHHLIIPTWNSQNRSTCQSLFQDSESLLTLIIPSEHLVLFRQSCQRCSYLGKVFDKSTIISR